MLETRILQLRETSLNAEVREEQGRLRRRRARQPRDRGRRGRGRESVYTLVSATEADAAAGSVSFESPVGRALDGARVGDVVVVPTPKGERRLVVRAIG